jgi:hypothetical protein
VLRHLFSDPYVCTIVITHAIYSINIVYTNGVAELYLLLSTSQELSFKCWENLVITPAHC